MFFFFTEKMLILQSTVVETGCYENFNVGANHHKNFKMFPDQF